MREMGIQFGPFRLHPTEGLTRDGREIRVTPKSLAVLGALAARPGAVVSKDELFRSVWPNSVVSDAALSTCIRELRRALKDDARRPRFIETLNRRGFRLLTSTTADHRADAAGDSARPLPGGPLVGRAQALASLVRSQAHTLQTGAAIVVVSGAEGVGKTTLVDRFLADSAPEHAWSTFRIASRDEHDRGDACRPLVDLTAQLIRRPRQPDLLAVLLSHAPTWLAELPGVLNDTERSKLQQRTSGATAARRMREFTDALIAVASHTPVIVWFEDLQDFDRETMAWLKFFARDPIDAPIMIIVTHTRGTDPICDAAIDALLASSLNSAIEVEPLDLAATTALVAERLRDPAGSRLRARLADLLCQRSGGLPMLLAGILDDVGGMRQIWADQPPTSRDAELTRLDIPTSVSDMLERRFAGLAADEIATLEAASVAGARFSAAEVAAACDTTVADTERRLIRLCDAALLRPTAAETWPDGTTARGFEFSHRLIRSSCYERISSPRRAALHRRVGHRLQTAWRDRSADVASTLAMHFERAAEFERAVIFLYDAGATARRRNASHIAIRHFQRALALLQSWPSGVDRALWEADLSAALGREFVITEGLRSERGNMHYARALTLQAELGMERRLGRILWMLWVFHINRGPLDVADELAEKLVRLAHETDDPALLLEAHHAKWGASLMQGKLVSVLNHTSNGIGLCSRSDGSLTMTTGCTLHDVHLTDHHAATCAGFFSAWAYVLGNRREAASRSVNAAIAHARDIEHPFTLAVTLVMSAGALAAGGDAGSTRHHAAEGRRLAEVHGFPALVSWGSVYEGWAATRLGEVESGLALMQQGLQLADAMGMSLFRPFQLALAADAQRQAGRLRDAEESLAEAFAIAEQVGDRLAIADLHRIRGELHLDLASSERSSAVHARALAEIEKAHEIATAQGASLIAGRAEDVLTRIEQQSSPTSRPPNRSSDAPR